MNSPSPRLIAAMENAAVDLEGLTRQVEDRLGGRSPEFMKSDQLALYMMAGRAGDIAAMLRRELERVTSGRGPIGQDDEYRRGLIKVARWVTTTLITVLIGVGVTTDDLDMSWLPFASTNPDAANMQPPDEQPLQPESTDEEADSTNESAASRETTHEGEAIEMVERLIVSPVSGVFRPRADLGENPIHRGEAIGKVGSTEVRSPFSGRLQGLLALSGEHVVASGALAWLRVE